MRDAPQRGAARLRRQAPSRLSPTQQRAAHKRPDVERRECEVCDRAEHCADLEALDVGTVSTCLNFAKALSDQGILTMERLERMPAHQAKKALQIVKMTEFQIDAIMQAVAPSSSAASAAAPAAAAAAGALGRVRVGAVAAAGAGFARAIGSQGAGNGQFQISVRRRCV